MKRRVNPRDLPFAAAGGTYHVVDGELQQQSADEPTPPAAAPIAQPEEPAAPAAEATPPARQHGGRPSRTKE